MTEKTEPTVLLQKIYVKDASIELPGAPAIFTRNEQPSIDVAMNSGAVALGNDHYHIVLTITVNAKFPTGETAYLVEVKQAGIFNIAGFAAQEEVEAVLGIFCPNTLFPFAREATADFIQKAGFPALLLQPVNFEALFMEARERRQAAAMNGEAAPTLQ